MNQKPKIFFIGGCQRSGTTLTRLILESHSKVSCIDEFRGYDILKNSHLMEEEMKINENKEWLGFKIPRLSEQLLEPFLADAGLDNIRIINRFDNRPTIFMVRNPLDTISSMKKLKQGDKSWLEVWANATIGFWRETIPDFENTYHDELEILGNTKFVDTVAGAIYWKVKNISYYNYLNKDLKIIRIRYEDLVTQPKQTISQILEFLGLEWEDSVLHHEKFIHSELDTQGLTIGKTNPRSSIYESSMNQYHENLSKEEISEIYNITKELMIDLNYYGINNQTTPKDLVNLKRQTAHNNETSFYRWIRILEYDLKIRDQKINSLVSLQEDNEQLRKEVISVNSQIINYETKRKELNELIKNKEEQIDKLNKELCDSQKSLNEIKNSTSWKILQIIRSALYRNQ